MLRRTIMSLHITPAFVAPLFLRPLRTPLQPAVSKEPSLPSQRPTTGPTTRRVPIARIRRGPKPEPVIPETLYDIEPLHDIDNKPVDFTAFRDRVVLIVNVASEDRRADTEYKLLAKMLDKYHSHGLEVVVFPCNWFGQYETGSHEQIKQFVHSNYSDRIKVMLKYDIEWNQVFALGRKYFPGEIIWNFHGKFLFGRKGLPVARFDLLTSPEYFEDQIGYYVHNTDSSIHTISPPPDSEDDPEDDWLFMVDKASTATAPDEEESDPDNEDDEDEDEEEEVDSDADTGPDGDADADGDDDVDSGSEENE